MDQDELLTTDAGISEAEQWRVERADDIPAKVISLIQRSKKAAHRRAHIRRRIVTLGVVVLVLVAVAVGFGISQARTANHQRIEALSRMVADEADRAGASDPSLAMQLSLAAYRIAPTPEARGSLLRTSTLHAATRLLGHAGTFTAVAFNPDGHTLATGSDDGTVRLWNLTDPRHLPVILTESLTYPLNTGNPFDTLTLSPDGHTLASGGNDDTVRLWDLTNPRHPALSAILPGLSSFIETVAFSPDGRILAIADDDDTIRLWDLTDPHRPPASAIVTGTPWPAPATMTPSGYGT